MATAVRVGDNTRVDPSGRSHNETTARHLHLVGACCAGAAAIFCVIMLFSSAGGTGVFPWLFGDGDDDVVRVTPKTRSVTKPAPVRATRTRTTVSRSHEPAAPHGGRRDRVGPRGAAPAREPETAPTAAAGTPSPAPPATKSEEPRAEVPAPSRPQPAPTPQPQATPTPPPPPPPPAVPELPVELPALPAPPVPAVPAVPISPPQTPSVPLLP